VPLGVVGRWDARHTGRVGAQERRAARDRASQDQRFPAGELPTCADVGEAPTRHDPRIPHKEAEMEIFWTVVVFAFVVAVLGIVVYATGSMFGAFHRHQH